jgi:uridine kinase
MSEGETDGKPAPAYIIGIGGGSASGKVPLLSSLLSPSPVELMWNGWNRHV